MEEPIIACDVSKGSSHIQGFIGLSNPVGSPFVVRHLKSDLKLIKELAKLLEKQTKRKPVFVFEYTGIYHECIARYISDIGLNLYAVSPLESAKVRKSSIRVTKTDSKDCLNIATVYYTRNVRRFTSDTNDVKALSRYKKSIGNQLIKQKCMYRRYIDLVWPCFNEYFDVNTKTAIAVVKLYRHPYILKADSSKKIAYVLDKRGNFSKTRLFIIADKLKEYATNSVSGVEKGSEYVNSLIDCLHRLEDLQNDLTRVNQKLDSILRKQMSYTCLKSIPGFGENILLYVVAEIGDWTRFKTAKQFVAYCGLDPSILQSGSNDGEHYSITRKGNGILRSALYLAVNQMLMAKKDNQITRFYFKKKSSGLSHKVAAVASCRKLACCIWGMLHNGTCFETI